MKAHHASLLAASITLTSALARADIGPLPGMKGVTYSFEVQNLEAFPGFTLLAFPCGTSNGVPVRAFVAAQTGKKYVVGKRGGSCTMYAMAKPDFDKWEAAHRANDEKTLDALEALFASPAVKKCTGGPTPTSVIDASDPRTAVHEVLRAKQIDATACAITSSSSPVASAAPPAPPATTAAAPTPSTPTTTPAPAPSAAAPAPPAPAKSGCGACEVGAASPPRVGWVLAALGLAGWMMRRARRGANAGER